MGNPFPIGPRTPTISPTPSSCRSVVTDPRRLMAKSNTFPPFLGILAIPKGASPPATIPQHLGDIHVHGAGIDAPTASCARNRAIMDGEIIEFTIEPVAQALVFHKTWVMPAC